MNIKSVLLVEDDPFHAQVVQSALKNEFGKIEIDVVSSEKEFHQKIQKFKWDVVILDQMIPWTTDEDPDPYTNAPEVGPRRAGTRCYELMIEKGGVMPIVVFFTNLQQEAVPQGAEYVRKKGDPKLTQLITKIKELRAKLR